MPIFYIRHGLNSAERDAWDFVTDSDGNPLEYGDGKSAATALEALRGRYERDFWRIPEAHSLFIYREPDAGEGDANWKEREAARFASGRYKPVPWEGDDELWTPPEHFAHIAESNTQKIAFTETEAKGRADKQKVLSAGEYLRTYVNGSQDKKTYYNNVMLGLSATVHFADNSDAIERIYLEIADYSRDNGDYSGVMSCMTYHGTASPRFDDCDRRARRDWDIHPVRVYGAGDLSLAYLRERDDDDAPIVARALVWPAKGICGRIYGHSAPMLRAALRAQGFGRFSDCALEGARLLVIPHPNGDNDRYVMPYLDGNHRFNWNNGKEYFAISDSGFDGSNTDGSAYTFPQCECERCGDVVRQNYTSNVNDETWCNSCASENSVHCDHCATRTQYETHPVIVGTYRARNGSIRESEETWCGDCCDSDATHSEHRDGYIADSEGETCDECDEFFLPDDLRDDDASRVCASCYADRHDDDDDAPEAPAAPAPAPEAPAPVPFPGGAYADAPRLGCPCHVCRDARERGLPERDESGLLVVPARAIVWDEIAPRPFPQWVLNSATE